MTDFRLYAVAFEIKYPAWNERGEHVFYITARTGAEAAKRARRQWKDNGNDSPLVIRSTRLAPEGAEPTDFR